MRQCIKLGMFFFPLSLAVLIFFQNCAEQAADSSSYASKVFKSAPFAYDASVDTLAYMSCSEMNSNYDPRGYFTFKTGAYTSASGLSLTSTFTNYVRNFSTSERLTALQTSDANKGAWLQMSLRQRTNYQNILASGSSAEADKDYYSFLQNLDSAPVANVLLGLSTNAKAAYFNAITDTSSRFMEGSIRFLGAEGIASSIRQQLTSLQAILTLTYTSANDMDSTAARSPSSNKAYGTGYMLSFNNDTGVTSGLSRVMDSVREMDLTTGATSGSNIHSWSCSTSLRFKIVRPEDVTAATNAGQTPPCQVLSSDNPISSTEQQIFQIVRRVLPSDYFSVDLANRCIVAKTPMQNYSCYGTRASNAPAIAYSATTCDSTNCPHYLSICTRL